MRAVRQQPGVPRARVLGAGRLRAGGGARAAGGQLLREDRSVGILAHGAYADIVGFRADLLDCSVDDLPSQQPALTLVGGRPVHDPDGLLG